MGIVGMSQTSVYELMNEWIDSDELRTTRAIFCRATIYKKVEEKSKQCDAPENLDVVLHANVSSLEVTIRYL
ncbi:unnamed protein product [Rhizopus microsporus]